MARISLIICDWCKKEFEEEKIQDGVHLKRADGKIKDFEVCRPCLNNIKNRLEARTVSSTPEKFYTKPVKILSDAIGQTIKETDSQIDDGPDPVEVQCTEDNINGKKTRKEFEREFKEAAKLKTGELQALPSNFKAPTRAEIIKKENMQGCTHTFKSYEGGKFICVDAPDGFSGSVKSLKGCGRVLMPDEI